LYRGSVGKGQDEFGGTEVNEVKNLVDYLPKLEKKLKQNFTENNKYLIGRSRGGMEMFLALAKFPELQTYFDKVVSLSGMIDLELSSKERPAILEMFKKKFGLTEHNQESWFKQRSVKYHIDEINKNFPILILQGTEDDRVSLKHGRGLFDSMKSLKYNVSYWEVTGAEHCLKNCTDLNEVIMQWLKTPNN
jgi:dipeptidyl aminopeptidase/acylaminoacyl peptidase